MAEKLKADIDRLLLVRQIKSSIHAKSIRIFSFIHSEKRFDWIIENYLFERLFLIQRNDLFELNRIWFKQSIIKPNKNLFK